MRTLSRRRIKRLQKSPGADLADVLEELVEERRLVDRMDLIDLARFVQLRCHLAVVTRRRLPARHLCQSSLQLSFASV